jgi:NADH dehydrogenase
MVQWGWNYFTRKRGARLITGKEKLDYYAPDKSREMVNV